MSSPPMIEARGLRRTFGQRVAVRDVDLDVARGTALAVFGSNGAGKSTLLQLLATALRPTAGTLAIDGLDPKRSPQEARGRLTLLDHQLGLYEELTARENLHFFAGLHGIDPVATAVDTALETFDVAHRADEPITRLSRGLKQRVALARALLHTPPLVLLDEPFTGLDRRASKLLERTIEGERQRGTTVIMVTHRIERGLRHSDRWLRLERGSLVADGTSDGSTPDDVMGSA